MVIDWAVEKFRRDGFQGGESGAALLKVIEPLPSATELARADGDL